MNHAPPMIRAKPTAWFMVSFSPRKLTEKTAKTIRVITSYIVFSSAVE